MRKKLQQKHGDLAGSELEELLRSLQEDGLLSDERFAETLIRGRISRGYGPFYIHQELAAKGIDNDLGDRLIEEANVDWLAMAQASLERRHPAAGEDLSAWMKAARFLQRRGFPGDLVRKALGPQPY